MWILAGAQFFLKVGALCFGAALGAAGVLGVHALQQTREGIALHPDCLLSGSLSELSQLPMSSASPLPSQGAQYLRGQLLVEVLLCRAEITNALSFCGILFESNLKLVCQIWEAPSPVFINVRKFSSARKKKMIHFNVTLQKCFLKCKYRSQNMTGSC